MFGTPYAPFDYGSGMGLEPVSFQEAMDLGLLPEDPSELSTDMLSMLEPDTGSLNSTLELSPAVRQRDLREALSQKLGGLAEWQGDKLVFTDTNGSRPYTAEKLAEVITAPLPKAFEHLPGKGQMQAEAVKVWAEAPAAFRKSGRGSDRSEDLLRLMERTEPVPAGSVVYRGEKWRDERAVEERLRSLGAGAPLHEVAASSSFDSGVAEVFAKGMPCEVIYEIKTGGGGVNIQPTVAKVNEQYQQEREVLFSQSARFKLRDVNRVQGPSSTRYFVSLEEI